MSRLWLPVSCSSHLQPLEGADEVHCVDSGGPLLAPNHLSLLMSEDASQALELALQQWERLKKADLEGEGQEFLDLLLQALALATLLQKVDMNIHMYVCMYVHMYTPHTVLYSMRMFEISYELLIACSSIYTMVIRN